MNMDNELRDALRRKQAPDDLADRVLARINNGEAQAEKPTVRSGAGAHPVLRWLAAAAVLAVTAAGAQQYYEQQQAAEAARVQEELRMALQITNDTLAVVQTKLSQPAENGSR